MVFVGCARIALMVVVEVRCQKSSFTGGLLPLPSASSEEPSPCSCICQGAICVAAASDVLAALSCRGNLRQSTCLSTAVKALRLQNLARRSHMLDLSHLCPPY